MSLGGLPFAKQGDFLVGLKIVDRYGIFCENLGMVRVLIRGWMEHSKLEFIASILPMS